ncbi:substrate binding domain-containing protein, partial [Pseudomonas syringae]|uniref:substrate binding domain-containing protein n=1 Tax=Pseudomonas syringae TaxID=317 RepID=UPI001F3BDF2A
NGNDWSSRMQTGGQVNAITQLASFERVCVASRAYLEKRGSPSSPDDLKEHDCLIYTLLSNGTNWRFKNTDVPISGRLRVNSPEAIREYVNAGLGIAQGPQWLYEEGLRSGNLQLLLNEYVAPPVPIQFVYLANRLLPQRAIVFMDFMADVFAAFHDRPK